MPKKMTRMLPSIGLKKSPKSRHLILLATQQREDIRGLWFKMWKKLPGKVKEIVKSEIESREYVELVHADEQLTAVLHLVVPRAEIGEVMGEFCAWIDAEALIPQDCLWECYLSGPESSSDPEKWRTELNRPLAS